jgi:hypothetical protein
VSDRPGIVPSEAGPPPDAASSVPASGAPETTSVGTQQCSAEVGDVLKGAEHVFDFPDDQVTSFWVKGDRFVTCDQREGRTTVPKALPLTPRESVDTYAVVSLFDSTRTAIRQAAGVVPAGAEGVFDVAYTFPDGHTEHATTATDDQGRTWWRMLYAYDTGGGNETKEPEIEVTVSYSGVQHTYTLQWGVHTCAQANHGC